MENLKYFFGTAENSPKNQQLQTQLFYHWNCNTYVLTSLSVYKDHIFSVEDMIPKVPPSPDQQNKNREITRDNKLNRISITK